MKLSIALCCKAKHTRPEKKTLTHNFGKKNGRLGRTFLQAMSEIELWTLSSLSSDSVYVASASWFLQTIKGGKKQKNFTSDRCRQAEVFNLWAYSERESHLSYLRTLSLARQSSHFTHMEKIAKLLCPKCLICRPTMHCRTDLHNRLWCTSSHSYFLYSRCFFLSMRRIFSFTSSTGRVVIWKNWVAEVKRGENDKRNLSQYRVNVAKRASLGRRLNAAKWQQ